MHWLVITLAGDYQAPLARAQEVYVDTSGRTDTDRAESSTSLQLYGGGMALCWVARGAACYRPGSVRSAARSLTRGKFRRCLSTNVGAEDDANALNAYER